MPGWIFFCIPKIQQSVNFLEHLDGIVFGFEPADGESVRFGHAASSTKQRDQAVVTVARR